MNLEDLMMSDILDWDAFSDDDDTDIIEGNIKPVEAPKACAIDQADCEACQ